MKDYGKCLVYISVYNGYNFIEETLEGVLAQDYPNFEIVLTDDCSTDGSREILERYVEKYPDKFHYRENAVNMGIGRTLFSAYKSNHEAAFFAGSGHDDIWEPSYLSSQITYLEQHQCVASFSRYRYINEHGKPIKKSIFSNEVLNQLTSEQLFAKLLRGNFLFAASGVVNLNIVGRNNFCRFFGYDSDRLQDYEMWLNLSLVGKISYNPNTIATYRVREHGMGDGQHHILQEHYERYSAVQRALFSPTFLTFLNRTKYKEQFINEVLESLEVNAETSQLLGLTMMIFCQYLLNMGCGTQKCKQVLKDYYFKSGLLTKSLHEHTGLPQKFKIYSFPGSKVLTEKLLKNSGCFSCTSSPHDADLIAITFGESLPKTDKPVICFRQRGSNKMYINSCNNTIFLNNDCSPIEFQNTVLLYLEDHTAIQRTPLSTQLVQQEIENLKASEIYRCGLLMYTLAERIGILKIVKRIREQSRIKKFKQ